MQLVAQIFRAAQYTGTEESADDVLAAVVATAAYGSVWTLKSFDADEVTLWEENRAIYGDQVGSDWAMHTGWWFVFNVGGVCDCLDDTAFQAKWQAVTS